MFYFSVHCDGLEASESPIFLRIDLTTGEFKSQNERVISVTDLYKPSSENCSVQALLRVNLTGKPYDTLKVYTHYSQAPRQWTLNIADAASNNGLLIP